MSFPGTDTATSVGRLQEENGHFGKRPCFFCPLYCVLPEKLHQVVPQVTSRVADHQRTWGQAAARQPGQEGRNVLMLEEKGLSEANDLLFPALPFSPSLDTPMALGVAWSLGFNNCLLSTCW